MPLEEIFHLGEIRGLRSLLRERHVDIVVDQHDQARVTGERE
jgi:hypothetical protein